jgi:hypothetical protein
VILLHEAGHWLGMRLFGYRDVSMLFIPLFGGAVAGRSEGVPGWQRAVVSLLGPAPGLLAGAGCAVVYGFTEGEFWLRLAEVLLVVNAFNLLPFQPLDGGRLLSEVLFCRNRWIELVTSMAGGAAVALLGGLIWWPLGIAGLGAILGAWWRFQTAGQADRLRERLAGWERSDGGPQPTPAPDPVEMAVDQVRRDSPETTDPRILAMRADSLLERLGARPPDWPATVALVAIHGALLVFALAAIVALALVWSHQGGPRGAGPAAGARGPVSALPGACR